MRIALLLVLAALTGCQNIHGADTERCFSQGHTVKNGQYMNCIIRVDRQRLAAWKAAHKPAKPAKKGKRK